ncbi:hypothetical protein ABWH96_19620 [Marivirga tractuosa]|uniref:hypothetical protein n=1 Tax=Marivirga tractuosa TaxID=1006 RepID=UPI0035D07F04
MLTLVITLIATFTFSNLKASDASEKVENTTIETTEINPTTNEMISEVNIVEGDLNEDASRATDVIVIVFEDGTVVVIVIE